MFGKWTTTTVFNNNNNNNNLINYKIYICIYIKYCHAILYYISDIISHKLPVKNVDIYITEFMLLMQCTEAVRKFGMSPRILRSFYTCTVESILTGCISAWFGNSTAGNRRALQRVVRTACHIVGGELPSHQDIYTRRCTRKARRIIKDSSHPSHSLLSLLPSGRHLCSIRSHTSRMRVSFFPRLSG